MKKIFNYIKTYTFYSTLIYLGIFIIFEFILSIFNVMLRSWIYQVSLVIIIFGILTSVIKNINKISKKIKKIICYIVFGIICLFLSIFIILFIAGQHRPTYIQRRNGIKYVAYVYSPWDTTNVYYYKYINPFIVNKKISIEEFYNTPANPFENFELMRYREVVVYYDKDGVTKKRKEDYREMLVYYYDESGENVIKSLPLKTFNDY